MTVRYLKICGRRLIFSTDRFERERQEISYSRGFSEVVAEAMNDPLHCRYITELTAQKIDSYRKMSNGMQVIQQKYMIERKKKGCCTRTVLLTA